MCSVRRVTYVSGRSLVGLYGQIRPSLKLRTYRRSQASALFVIACEAKCPTWPGGPPI